MQAVRHSFSRVGASLALLALALVVLTPNSNTSQAARLQLLTLDIGEGELINLPSAAESVFVADPDIADVQVNGTTSILVFGVQTGRTTLYALDSEGRTLFARDLRIQHNMDVLEEILAERFPGHRVYLTSAPNTLMVEGAASTPQEAQAILATLRGVIGDDTLIDRMSITTPTQVNIRVRVAEVQRNLDQRLGFNWQALFNAGDFAFGVITGRDFLVGGIGGATDLLLGSSGEGAYFGSVNNSKVSIDALIDALDAEGLARTLAEPNLTAVSGETASFIVGGEFPIPVAQDLDRTTIEFKQFGVVLDFTPTVLSPERISMQVRPEVSALTDQGAIEIQGFRIPALTVRRVETTVELGSGQSLVLGGLLQENTRDLVSKVPGIGDIPVLGSLFTSTRYQNDQTELVVIVTPYVVRPTSPDELETPLGRYGPNRPLERLLLGKGPRQLQGVSGKTPRLSGPAGFIY